MEKTPSQSRNHSMSVCRSTSKRQTRGIKADEFTARTEGQGNFFVRPMLFNFCTLSPTLSPTYDIINTGDKVGEIWEKYYFYKEEQTDE
jgi:hypothetical protein